MLFLPRSRALLPALCAVLGCRTAPPPPEAPPALLPAGMKIERVQALGSVLSGPLATEESLTESPKKSPGEQPGEQPEDLAAEQGSDLEADFVFDMTLIALASSPVGLEFQELAPRTAVVLDPELPRPLLAAAPGLMKGAGLARGEAATEIDRRLAADELGRHRVAAHFAERLQPGKIARLGLTAVETPEERDNFLREWPVLGPVTKGLALNIDLAEDGISSQVAAEWRDVAKPRTAAQKEEARLERPDRPGSALSLQREMILIQPTEGPLQPGEGPLFVLMNTPFHQAGARAWLARIELRAESTLSATELESLRDTEAAETLAPRARDRRTPAELQAATLEHAAKQLELTSDPRGALSFIASGTGALLAQDLSLALLDAEWAGFFDTFTRERDFRLAANAESSPEDLAWLLEASAYRYLALAADEDRLSAPGQAVLLRHAGALGRFPGTIEELISEYADLNSFRERVVFENRVFLEDSSPSDRVRAHDWLSVRDLAVPNYDPLDSRSVRRAALEESERIREEKLKAIADGARELEAKQ